MRTNKPVVGPMNRGIVPSALTGSCVILEVDEFVTFTGTVDRDRLPGDAAEDAWELTAFLLPRERGFVPIGE